MLIGGGDVLVWTVFCTVSSERSGVSNFQYINNVLLCLFDR